MRTIWRALTASVALAVASAVIVIPTASAVPTASEAAATQGAAPTESGNGTAGTDTSGTDTTAHDTTDAAQAAGIDQPGDAYMGWSVEGADGTSPNSTAETPYATNAPRTAAGTVVDAPQQRMQVDAPQQGLQALPPIVGIEGIDVSHHNGYVDWQYWWDQGRRFAYVKATEGTHFTDPLFAYMYNGSYNAGMIRGAYHFARPDESSGAAQATFFAAHGGAWSADAKTLPGVLDIESNPYGKNTCYGLNQAQMRGWIKSFTERYQQLTGRNAVIYSSPAWWSTCTGNTAMFAYTNPLWIAHWNTNAPRIPTGWTRYTFWQYNIPVYNIVDNTHYRMDADRFYGNASGLRDFAIGKWDVGYSAPAGAILKITPNSLSVASPGAKYSLALTASGGIGTYEFRISAGKLPAGLHLSKKGVVSGTPTHPGVNSWVTIDVRDDHDGAGRQAYSIYTTFTDMPKSQLFFRPVSWMASNGLTFGYEDGTFRPSVDVNRGSMAAFLYRYVNPGASAPQCTTRPFPDVTTGSLFCGHISWLKTTGITKPSDGKYHSSNSVTRGSMTAFLYRLTHPGKKSPTCTSKPFKDVSTGNVFCGYIKWAKDNGIAKGYGSGTNYGPNNAVTRGAMAAFLSRIDALR